MRNTLRYLLIVALLSMTSVLSMASVSAQDLAQQPQAQMQSTSVMPASGSTLPQAAIQGTKTTYSEQLTSTTTVKAGMKKAGRPGDWSDPYTDPVGDALWPLALLACAYTFLMFTRKRRIKD